MKTKEDKSTEYKETISVSIDQETRLAIAILRQRGLNISQLFRNAVKDEVKKSN